MLRNDVTYVTYVAIGCRSFYYILPFMDVLVSDSMVTKVLMDHVTTFRVKSCARCHRGSLIWL